MNQAEQLVKEHYGYVVLQAQRLAPVYHVEVDDLIQQGLLGILRARKTYVPNAHAKFLSYAKFWILRRMQDWIYRTADQVRVPAHKFGKLGFRERSLQSFTEDEDLIYEAFFGLEEVARATAHTKDVRRLLETAISQLRPKQARVVRALFFEGLSSPEVAARFGVTHQAVASCKKDALAALRQMRVIREALAA